MENQPWTIQRLLVWTTEFFQKRGLDSPRVAAEVLLAEALGCPRIQLYARFNEVPTEPHLGTFREWVKRHATGEPVAHLVGYREFYSLRFKVSRDVLIPRPETEHVVMLAIDKLRDMATGDRSVLDMGTGSGCIAITLARQVPNLQVTAVDVSPAALAIAADNAAAHEVSDRIDFIQSDLFDNLPSDLRVSVIVSNPPYVGRREKGTLDPTVKQFEPELALYGGDEGEELSFRLLDTAVDHLNPGGWLILETSPFVAPRLIQKIAANPAYQGAEIKKDLAKQDRILLAQRVLHPH